MKTKKRIISLLLCLAMVFSMIESAGMPVFAKDLSGNVFKYASATDATSTDASEAKEEDTETSEESKGESDDISNSEEVSDYEVIKRKKFKMRPMDVDEAILQMNMLDHEFYMFTNADTGEINVVYKRDDGNYAVLEPDNQ